MLQDFLTVAIEIIAVGFALVMAIEFVQGIARRIQESQQPAAPALQKESVPPQIAAEPMLEDPWLTTLTPSVTEKTAIAIAPLALRLLLLPPAIVALQPMMDIRPSKAKPKKKRTQAQTTAPAALALLSAVQLRQHCSARGVQWRNARGKGRHLTKQEMIDRLTA
ncbi:hypothetical protein [Chroococcidiopsis sp.]|uniref:hypothetical protein n=1 Tax=Chroococcidiopsis sp. TaxID=3088168 RepID=UPI003F323A92